MDCGWCCRLRKAELPWREAYSAGVKTLVECREIFKDKLRNETALLSGRDLEQVLDLFRVQIHEIHRLANDAASRPELSTCGLERDGGKKFRSRKAKRSAVSAAALAPARRISGNDEARDDECRRVRLERLARHSRRNWLPCFSQTAA